MMVSGRNVDMKDNQRVKLELAGIFIFLHLEGKTRARSEQYGEKGEN